jgi:hypothetical protein
MNEHDFQISAAIADAGEAVDTISDIAMDTVAGGMGDTLPEPTEAKASKPRRGAGVAKVRQPRKAKAAKADSVAPTETVTTPVTVLSESDTAAFMADCAKAKAETVGEPEAVPSLSYVNLPVDFVSAALSVASTEETRYYLNGVFLQSCDGAVRIVGTDGHRLFAGAVEMPQDSDAADWLRAGVILPREGLKARLALIAGETAKGEAALVRVGFAVGARNVTIGDEAERMTFRLNPVGGTFPDYQRIFASSASAMDGRTFEPLSANTYAGKYLKDVGTMSKVLGAEQVSIFGSADNGPTVVTFPEIDGAMMLLMPMRCDAPVKVETARIAGPGGLKMVLAGLKANRNRLIREASETSDDGQKAEKNAKAEALAGKIATLEEAARKAIA